MSRPLFMAIEGLSCTGKTSVVRQLAPMLGAVQPPTVPSEYTALRQRFNRQEELNARFLLFLSAISLASLEIQRHLQAGSHVAVESYVGRTTAFHKGMGASVQITLPDLLRPDVTYFLICDMPERARRQRERGGVRHYWDIHAENCQSAILREYKCFDMHVIDTTRRQVDEVVASIIRHPLDGSCTCENTQPVAGYPNLLSIVPERVGEA
jgi:thymidylate kinase